MYLAITHAATEIRENPAGVPLSLKIKLKSWQERLRSTKAVYNDEKRLRVSATIGERQRDPSGDPL
jgi:hypothetical protein